MMFNKKYGDFGLIQMPTIIISGIIAIVLFSSLVYYGLKPYVISFYNSIFIDFDFYTLIKTFKFDFNILDLNFMAISVAVTMLVISILILIKSHSETKENNPCLLSLSLVSECDLIKINMEIISIVTAIEIAV